MIKRLIGFLVTVAVLAVVVLTVLHRDRFRTMLRIGEPSEQPVVPRDTLPASAPTEQTLPDAADGRLPVSPGIVPRLPLRFRAIRSLLRHPRLRTRFRNPEEFTYI